MLVGGAHDATAQSAPTGRTVLSLGVGGRPASRTFRSSQIFPAFFELGNFQANYEIDGGLVIDGGLSFRLWRNLGVGLDVSSYRSVSPAQITADVPHPFFFDFPRSSMGETDGLERQELAMHISAMWMMQFFDWLVVSVSGGPSLINARQDLVASVQHTEVEFPFDQVILAGYTVESRSRTLVGLNGGVDFGAFILDKLPLLNRYEVVKRMGVGVLLRYVRGTTDLMVGDDTIDVHLGGLQLTVGLRMRF